MSDYVLFCQMRTVFKASVHKICKLHQAELDTIWAF